VQLLIAIVLRAAPQLQVLARDAGGGIVLLDKLERMDLHAVHVRRQVIRPPLNAQMRVIEHEPVYPA